MSIEFRRKFRKLKLNKYTVCSQTVTVVKIKPVLHCADRLLVLHILYNVVTYIKQIMNQMMDLLKFTWFIVKQKTKQTQVLKSHWNYEKHWILG